MKKVIFKKVGMKNFGPYIEPMELTFESNKLILISGPNGIGKTMMFDAISFCLYGITSKGARGDDVVNNIVGKNCHTWLEFSIDNDQYKLDRYHKYVKHGNTVYLFKNDMNKPIKKGQQEVLPEIEKIIAPKKLFMNTLMFGQKVNSFFTDLTNSEKQEIFRKILELSNYIFYYKEADQRLKMIGDQISEVTNNIHVKFELINDSKIQLKYFKKAQETFKTEKNNRIKVLKNSLNNLTELYNKWDLILKNYEKQDLVDIEKIIEEINKTKNNISLIESKNSIIQNNILNKKKIKEGELNQKALKLKEEIISSYQKDEDKIKTDFNNEKSKISNKVNEYINSKNLLENNIINIEIEIKRNIEEKQEIIENVIDSKISICPTCKQKINSKIIESLKNKIIEFENIIKNKQKELEENKLERENYLKMLIIKSEDIDKNKQAFFKKTDKINLEKKVKLQEIYQRVNNATEKLERLVEDQLAQSSKLLIVEKEQLNKNLESNQLLLIKQKEILQKKLEAENSFKSTKESILNTQTLIQEKEQEEYDKTQLNSYIERLKILTIEIKELEKRKRQFEITVQILQFWKTGFSSSGIPSMLIDEAIPFMNQRVSYYLDQISNGRYIVSFDTISTTKGGEYRDKFSVNMFDSKTQANSKLQFSGGQTRIVDISTILTLSDLQARERGISFNILLFDEIFDSLDEENVGFVSGVLRKLVKDKTICLISHRNIDQIEADINLNLR